MRPSPVRSPALLLGPALAALIAVTLAGCPPPGGAVAPAPPGPGSAAAAATPPASGSAAAATSGSAAASASAARVAGQPPDANMLRAQIPERYKWKLDALFADDAAFEQALGALPAARREIEGFAGKLGRPAELRGCLERYFATRLGTNRVMLYAALRFDSDQKSSTFQGMHERALAALDALMASAAFIRREVLALDDAAVATAYRNEPKLAEYRPYLDELRRRRKRVLGAQAERVLSLAGDNLWAEVDLNEIPSDIEKVFKAVRADLTLPKITDEQGQSVPLTLASYGKYRASSVRSVRRDAVEALFGTLRGYQNTFAAALAGQLRQNVLFARARGYDTALEAYLDKDDIDPAVYRSLIAALGANLAPLHRYVALRKKLLGVPELHVYDLYSPMLEGIRMRMPYDRGVAILPEALGPLGNDYVKALREALDPARGWIDVYPHANKESGAFSSSVFGVHPFVKLNYQDELDDLSTLAHECGHALHSQLSMTAQPYVTAGYASFIGEIASTLDEKLLSDYLLAHAGSDDERLFILNRLLETIRTTIYRQAMFAEFELLAHTAVEQDKPLTADLLNQTYASLIARYYGPDLTMGPNDAVEWAYIPHFYYKYYLFTYATGLSAGITLAEKVRQGGPAARDAYLGMLKGGSSRPPLALLRSAGVDLTKPEAIETAARLMDRTLGEIETILARRGAPSQ